MSQTYGTSPSGGAMGDDALTPGSQPDNTRDVAAEEARGVAGDAAAAGQQTAATAKEQATQVADEAKVQARQVYDQAKQELGEQMGSQHQRAASGLSALADELSSMVQGSDQQGMVSDLARQASDRAREAARWLESREPGDVLDEVKSFARRRPGAFLAAAAVAGLVGGRLTRGLADQAKAEKDQPSRGTPYMQGPPRPTLTQTPGGIPPVQPAYSTPPSDLSDTPTAGTVPLDDPLEGPLVVDTPANPGETYGETYGEERR